MSLHRQRVLSIVLACTILVLMPSTGAEEGGKGPAAEPRKIRLDAFSVGEVFWFEVEGIPGRNPEVTLEPGEQVEVTLYNRASIRHNLHFGDPVNETLPVLEPTRQQTIRFSVPETGQEDAQYWCQLHRGQGMIGPVAFGEPGKGLNIQLDGPTPVLLLVFAMGLLGVLRRMRC